MTGSGLEALDEATTANEAEVGGKEDEVAAQVAMLPAAPPFATTAASLKFGCSLSLFLVAFVVSGGCFFG